ncbi:Phosphorylase superfamily protein [Perilla frutescens var. hirtella]|uniref:Phosphorylase superfamily protein n=1 Tax=Perilla frutescens var. hirtella TaxID=608512 RepID=A0AAD4JMQ3_PERFH|nr:Phosphorylase superfamily protein [Perilla frutescens var. hirtella]
MRERTQRLINEANKDGPYLGLVIPNMFEMNPLLQHPTYKPTNLTIDFAGKRFRFGTIYDERVVLVMTGLAMLNAGVTTQLLLSLFNVKGVVHYGIAGNADTSLNVGDVTIPKYWSHTSLWNWQRYGDGPEDELPLEANGDYTRKIGYLKFANYATNVSNCSSNNNLLNNVWYQPEEIFPVDGVPEQRQHAFWVPVNSDYLKLAKKLEGLELDKCVNSTTCLSISPKVTIVSKGASANIFLANDAYKFFLNKKFKVSPIDMESAAVALVCHQQRVPFVIFRALSGGGSAKSNEAAAFVPLAANNSVAVVVEFIKILAGLDI